MGDLCDNIGLMLESLLAYITASPSRYMTQPSGIPILSLCMLVIPILNSKNFLVTCTYKWVEYTGPCMHQCAARLTIVYILLILGGVGELSDKLMPQIIMIMFFSFVMTLQE